RLPVVASVMKTSTPLRAPARLLDIMLFEMLSGPSFLRTCRPALGRYRRPPMTSAATGRFRRGRRICSGRNSLVAFLSDGSCSIRCPLRGCRASTPPFGGGGPRPAPRAPYAATVCATHSQPEEYAFPRRGSSSTEGGAGGPACRCTDKPPHEP